MKYTTWNPAVQKVPSLEYIKKWKMKINVVSHQSNALLVGGELATRVYKRWYKG
jgi:hypothetical protein